MNRSVPLLLALVLAVAGTAARYPAQPPSAPATAAANELWYVHYANGLRAIERGAWPAAIAELERAAAKNRRSSSRARTYGMVFIHYYPYYYLGVAHYNAGNVDRALEYLRQEERAGQMRRSSSHRRQLDVLLAAAAGPGGSTTAVAAAASRQRDDHAGKLAEAGRLLERGEHARTLALATEVLAVEPGNAEAARLRAAAERQVLETELARVEVNRSPAQTLTPGTRPVRTDTAAQAYSEPPLTEAAIFEAKAWELLRGGRELLIGGEVAAALARFELVLGLAQDLGLPGGLVDEARLSRDAADAEIRRVAEARRQAEIAAATEAAREPPRIAVVTPTTFDEPVRAEIITVQGVVMDNYGVADLEILVNGRSTGDVQVATRGITAVMRPGGAQAQRAQRLENQGTVVNFYKHVRLTDPVNTLMIRARNVNGQVTEESHQVRLDAQRPQVWAAIIGIGDYQHPLVPNLNYTVADADAMYRYVVDDLGVPASNVFKLIDAQATTSEIKTVLGTRLRQLAGKDDLVIIYFAGHGAPEQDPNVRDADGMEKYLLSYEADPDDLYGSAFSMGEIATIFGRIQADRVIFIADACYSGASGGRTVFSTRQTQRASITDDFLTRVAESGRGRVILSASSANQPSQERSDLGHGVFTYYLLEGLRGAADRNGDGVITIDEAYYYVAEKVPQATGQSQHPVKKGEVEGELILGRVLRR